ncbi:hypothetical protein [Paraclostridium bifermentans]|uniref:hypothetical protein n=1 Tax=Paraclostridium bifermentans TaxID=1490 RepID=UPI001FF20EFE|nr:hypothetical protein [Paraclostridium bifermentans]UOW69058.1 hypothetical protein MTR78_06405 [Paraclostridium bifermentans]
MLKFDSINKKINELYDYGEISKCIDLIHLLDFNFILLIENKHVITNKWIKFSSKVSREDFISSLLCYYPPLLNALLIRVYNEVLNISKSGDSKALFEFVDSVPKFAEEIINIKDEELVETEEIKSLYQIIFNGIPQYQAILNKLKTIQLVEDAEDIEVTELGRFPNDNWIEGRRITSSVDLKPLDTKNTYTLVPYRYDESEVEEEIRIVLSNPWKTYVTTLFIIASQYKVENIDGIAIRPIDYNNYYSIQDIEVYIYNKDGVEINIGNINNFTDKFCSKHNLYLFPDKAPEVNKIVIELLEDKIIDFKDGEYILKESFKDILYSKDIVLKNKSRKFRETIKDYIEDLRSSL